MKKVTCPFCSEEQTQKPIKSWAYGKMILKRSEKGTTWGPSVSCSRYECKCGNNFQFYLSTSGKSWTIPKKS